MLLGTNSWHRCYSRGRGLFGALPSPPRCIICAAPFKGPFTSSIEILRSLTSSENPTLYTEATGILMRTGALIERFMGDQIVGRADGMVDLTALGEDMNIAARLASAAGSGEIVISERTYRAASPGRDAERRDLTLGGVSGVVRVRVLRA